MARNRIANRKYPSLYSVADLEAHPGLTAKEQATAIGCSVATVFALRAEQRGYAPPSAPEKTYSVADLEPYLHLSHKEQLAALGVSVSTLNRLRREAGLIRKRLTVADWVRVSRAPGVEAQAAALGCSTSTIITLRREARALGILPPVKK